MGAMRNAYSILLGKLEGNRPLERHRLRGEDDIEVGFKEMVLEGVE
jgi:hypothetical protein